MNCTWFYFVVTKIERDVCESQGCSVSATEMKASVHSCFYILVASTVSPPLKQGSIVKQMKYSKTFNTSSVLRCLTFHSSSFLCAFLTCTPHLLCIVNLSHFLCLSLVKHTFFHVILAFILPSKVTFSSSVRMSDFVPNIQKKNS